MTTEEYVYAFKCPEGVAQIMASELHCSGMLSQIRILGPTRVRWMGKIFGRVHGSGQAKEASGGATNQLCWGRLLPDGTMRRLTLATLEQIYKDYAREVARTKIA